MIVTIDPGEETAWHRHGVPTYIYILAGEVTVDYGEQGQRDASGLAMHLVVHADAVDRRMAARQGWKARHVLSSFPSGGRREAAARKQ